MPKVKEDDQGIFIQTGGYIFRPGDINGCAHAYEMDDGGLRKGDDVKARHVAGSQLAKLKLADGSVRYWGNHPLDDPHRVPPKPRDGSSTISDLLPNIIPKRVMTRFNVVAETLIAGHRYPLGEIRAASYEDAAIQAKTLITDDNGPVEFIVVIGPESDMAVGRSVRKYDFATLDEIRKR
jgi:hypothetical protein